MKPSLVVALAGLGLAAGWGLQLHSLAKLSELRSSVEQSTSLAQLALARSTARVAAPVAGVPLTLSNSCSGPSGDEVRAIVQQELARAAAKTVADAEKDVIFPDPVENDDAFREASRIVRDALAAHVWGEHDAEQLRRLKVKLSPEQIAAINGQLFPAMNRQELRVDAVPAF